MRYVGSEVIERNGKEGIESGKMQREETITLKHKKADPFLRVGLYIAAYATPYESYYFVSSARAAFAGVR